MAHEGRLPDHLIACVGGGSNAIGLFHAFVGDKRVKMAGVEAGGFGIESGKHAARFSGGRPGVLQGTMTYLLQDEHGQVNLTHSVSAGLDYAAVGPSIATIARSAACGIRLQRMKKRWPHSISLRVKKGSSLHWKAHMQSQKSSDWLRRSRRNQIILANLSGRGDKDVQQVAKIKGVVL